MGNEHDSPSRKPKKKRLFLKILAIIVLLLSIAGFYFYNNFNRLLSEALMKSFNSNIVSDVYELKFEKLKVNLFDGDIKVLNVIMAPREKPLNSYPYINSSFILKTEKILLTNVQILQLLKLNELQLEKIEIIKPEIQLTLEGKVNIMFPIKDTIAGKENKNNKKFVESFLLKEFRMEDASFHVSNGYKERQFRIEKLNISVNDLFLSQQSGRDMFSYKKVDLLLGEFAGKMQKGPLKQFSFRNYHLKIDSLSINKTIDTLIFGFNNFNTSIEALDIQTRDSIFHIQMKSFDLSYKDKSIKMSGIGFKPNMSFAKLQKSLKYSHTDFAIAIGSLNINNLNFDSLIFKKELIVDNIIIDSVRASIYSDLTKELDTKSFPQYLGQNIMSISMPLKINKVEVRNVNLDNTERILTNNAAKVNINRGTVIVKNISNHSDDDILDARIEAYIENKVKFNINLGFRYSKPQFTLEGIFGKFNLPDLNPVLAAYTPGKINKGIADRINFSGTITRTNSTGTMAFLYHDLDVDLQLKNKAKWKSTLGTFAANAYLPAANPASQELPPRIVKYKVERNLNKGFIQLIIKSVLSGLKETVYMNKENRKAYKEEKKKVKKKNKNG